MKASGSRRARFYSSSATTTTVTYTIQNEHSSPQTKTETTQIPVESPSDEPPIPITVHVSTQFQARESLAALKIQAAYRSYIVRNLVKKISAVNFEANLLQRLIQRQETVDAVRTNERERIKINEALMGLLLMLDSIPGVDQTVRELRRHMSRRIVGLQEILDSISDARVESWDGFLREWDDALAGIEKEVCRERGGGHEMERFCAENLGFRCLQRFLREQ
ncbi:unnamed protein product [Ilex paraguariensis]|uniref:BAG domain-containing protein n=1 Tax=Ilex paraguariensis TaxID=185542 RepID=A0ABC8UMD2_9AQUA